MNKNHIISEILHIPEGIMSNPNKSLYAYCAEICQLFSGSHITNDDLLKALQESPRFISLWLAYSESKRTSNGWFFRKINAEKYGVGFFDGKDISNEQVFCNSAQACALFISKETETLYTQTI